MKEHRYLGIYLKECAATVICVDAKELKPLDGFSVTCEPGDSHWDDLAKAISETCAKQNINYTEVAVALDCELFMQHQVHSEFTDPRQVASTIRFDAEESLATDISEVATGFYVIETGEDGSQAIVFTIDHSVLSKILLALRGYNLDPMTIEPDVYCLKRFLEKDLPSHEQHTGDNLYFVSSLERGYFVSFTPSLESKDSYIVKMRSSTLAEQANRQEFLAKEIPLTLARYELMDSPIAYVFDSFHNTNPPALSNELQMHVETFEIDPTAGTVQTGPHSQVAFALAWGAAASLEEKVSFANFRREFMPYQGKQERMNKAIRLVSVALTVLLLIVGVHLQVQLIKRKAAIKKIHSALVEDYTKVIGKEPRKRRSIVKLLGDELNRVENLKSGKGEASVPGKVVSILSAFNFKKEDSSSSIAQKVQLSIETISVGTNNIKIVGETKSRDATLELFEALRDMKMDILQEGVETKGNRDHFTITLVK